MQSFGIDTAPQSFCHSFITLSMITLYKVSPETRCSGVKTRCCCYCSFHSTKHLCEFPTGSPRTGVSNRPTGGIYKFCDFLSNLPYSDHFSRPPRPRSCRRQKCHICFFFPLKNYLTIQKYHP